MNHDRTNPKRVVSDSLQITQQKHQIVDNCNWFVDVVWRLGRMDIEDPDAYAEQMMASSPAISFQNPHFMAVMFRDGKLIDLSNDQHPTSVHGWGHDGHLVELDEAGTHFGFVMQGDARLIRFADELSDSSFSIAQGMYFCVPGRCRIEGGTGVIFSRIGFQGMFTIGGPIERKGRLRYIDGCSDSLLISPAVKGDACLNYLHFPAGINQTRHTHPSLRVGIVAKGKGRCVVPANEDGTGADVTVPLVPGQVFVIPTDGHHSFFTDDDEMDIIAYHPDSDTGPDHDDHPMINRTIVGGVSAAEIDAIRTR